MRGSFLDKHLEKLLVGTAFLALVYALVAGGPAKAGKQISIDGAQYFRAQRQEYAPGRYVTATVAEGKYWDPAVNRFIFVAPIVRHVLVFKAVDLDPPLTAIPTPPAPLPQPGPGLMKAWSLDRMNFQGGGAATDATKPGAQP
jgi:hypothetical protein